jgi:hypothetical protein
MLSRVRVEICHIIFYLKVYFKCILCIFSDFEIYRYNERNSILKEKVVKKLCRKTITLRKKNDVFHATNTPLKR